MGIREPKLKKSRSGHLFDDKDRTPAFITSRWQSQYKFSACGSTYAPISTRKRKIGSYPPYDAVSNSRRHLSSKLPGTRVHQRRVGNSILKTRSLTEGGDCRSNLEMRTLTDGGHRKPTANVDVQKIVNVERLVASESDAAALPQCRFNSDDGELAVVVHEIRKKPLPKKHSTPSPREYGEACLQLQASAVAASLQQVSSMTQQWLDRKERRNGPALCATHGYPTALLSAMSVDALNWRVARGRRTSRHGPFVWRVRQLEYFEASEKRANYVGPSTYEYEIAENQVGNELENTHECSPRPLVSSFGLILFFSSDLVVVQSTALNSSAQGLLRVFFLNVFASTVLASSRERLVDSEQMSLQHATKNGARTL
ncbi:hypothetical protein C8R45DRAFT_1152665 [Mycena sanguinolenta]|nr:hypothetical protein C8R45DRAFT_1152665 [Mycena sanguinolenta]